MNELHTEAMTRLNDLRNTKTTIERLREKHQIIINVFPIVAAIDSNLVDESTREHYPAVPCYIESDISDVTTDTSVPDDTLTGPQLRATGADASAAAHVAGQRRHAQGLA